MPGQDLLLHNEADHFYALGDAHQEMSASHPKETTLANETINSLVVKNREEVAQALSSL